ncbi:MAG: hypothetical protein RLY43_2419, partial [Bacteroidota bacterium]
MYFYFIFYTVLFSSSLPVIFLLKNSTKIEEFYEENKLFILFLIFRFLTDISVFIFSKIYGNSFPVFYFSVICEFLILVNLFDKVYPLKHKKFLYLLGFISLIIDLLLTMNLFSDNVYSTLITFVLIIGITGKIIISNNTTRENELLVYSIFLYYILALSYTFFQK